MNGTRFVIVQADCTNDKLQSILRDAGLPTYANQVQPGAFATVTIAYEDITQVCALLDQHDIEHGI